MKRPSRLFTVITFLITTSFISGCRERDIPDEIWEILYTYIGYWNTGQFEGIENVLCEDFELVESPDFKPRRGIQSFKDYITDSRIAYPDFHLTLDEMMYVKDRIAIIWSLTATNTGPGLWPPTGKTINGKGISVIHLYEGKIQDEWLSKNDLLWMTQLGYTFTPPGEIKNK